MNTHRQVARIANLNSGVHAWAITLAFCSWLPGCGGKASDSTPPEKPQFLSAKVNDEFKDAYDRTIAFGAVDWTDKCGYVFGYDSSPEFQYRQDARYFNFRNGIQFNFVRQSKTKIRLNDPEWDSLTDQDCILSSIGVNNSRMLRYSKSEKVYFVSELNQESDGTTILSGFTGGHDSQFLYTGMTEELARQHIKLSGNVNIHYTNEESMAFISKAIDLRKYWESPEQLDSTDVESWISVMLPNRDVLHIQLATDHASRIIGTMIYENPKESPLSFGDRMTPDLRFLELQVINLVNPVLTRWQAEDSDNRGDGNSENIPEAEQKSPAN